MTWLGKIGGLLVLFGALFMIYFLMQDNPAMSVYGCVPLGVGLYLFMEGLK